MRKRGRAGLRAFAAALPALLLAAAAAAEWLAPDPSYRDAQIELRAAARDTAGHGAEPARLDTLALALLRLDRFAEARGLFERVRSQAPDDAGARAGLGKLALFEDRLGEAESLLAGVTSGDPGVAADLFATRVRHGQWLEAAAVAAPAGQAGRAALLEELGREGAYAITAPKQPAVEVPWARAWPVPLVRARLNGQSVLLAISTGAGDLVLDQATARRCGVRLLGEQAPVWWCGTRAAARMALAQRLEIGGLRVERVPAAALSLRRYSLVVNPQGEGIGGVIGFGLLRRFTPTLDWKRQRLVLAPAGGSLAESPGVHRIPFRIEGESHVMVEGTIGGGRPMQLIVDTAVPECAIGAPREVFEELGLRPGVVSRMMRGAGVLLNGPGWSAVSVPAVTLGTLSRDRLPGWSGALDPAELWRNGVRRDALLSSAFFRGMRVTFDWAGGALLIEEK